MEHPNPSTIAANVAAYLTNRLSELGISQRAAADQTGIPLTTLSRRLAGRGPFPLDEVALLADLIREPLVDVFAAAGATTDPVEVGAA